MEKHPKILKISEPTIPDIIQPLPSIRDLVFTNFFEEVFDYSTNKISIGTFKEWDAPKPALKISKKIGGEVLEPLIQELEPPIRNTAPRHYLMAV